jgi:hypothetical protein
MINAKTDALRALGGVLWAHGDVSRALGEQ